jgi:glycosyltransferase involved in cell wall biosynthesis
MTPTQGCVIVVPCYNEAVRLQPQRYSDFLAQDSVVNFLFVNDGSRDGTLRVLESLRAKHPDRVSVLDKQPNGGKAEAVRSGLLTALDQSQIAITGYWDADLATPLEVIPQFLAKMASDPKLEMVFGSRVRLLGHDIRRKPLRHYLGRCFGTGVSIVLGLPIYDTQCGAKLLRVTPALRSILATRFQSRWIFDVEIIARFLAFHKGDRLLASQVICEDPLPRWEDVGGSKVRPSDFFVAFYELMKIRKTFRRVMR